MINSKLYWAWDGNPPNIQAISFPMPDAPYLPLAGGCTSRMSLEDFLKDVQRDFDRQTGCYYAYVFDGDKSEEDTYVLTTWDVTRPDNECYEAIVILYYSPLNPYLTIKKHMGEELAEEYLQRIPAVAN